MLAKDDYFRFTEQGLQNHGWDKYGFIFHVVSVLDIEPKMSAICVEAYSTTGPYDAFYFLSSGDYEVVKHV